MRITKITKRVLYFSCFRSFEFCDSAFALLALSRVDPFGAFGLQSASHNSRQGRTRAMRKSLAIMLIPTLAFAGWFLHTEAQTPQPIAPPAGIDAKSAKPRDGGNLPEQAEPIFFSTIAPWNGSSWRTSRTGDSCMDFSLRCGCRWTGTISKARRGRRWRGPRARYFRDGRGSAIARQAALTLLELETMVDPKEPAIRTTAAPPTMVNRLSAHGLLISAIHELADAGRRRSARRRRSTCNYLKQQQKPNGMLFVTVGSDVLERLGRADAEHAGWALQGIIRSQRHRPAAWKLDMVRSTRAAYFAAWQQNKSLPLVYSQTPAYAEAYAQTKDAAFAETVFAMNDWLLGLQYREEVEFAAPLLERRVPALPGWKNRADRARYQFGPLPESLAEACRLAKLMGDLPRYERYERGLIQSLHFLMSLQYAGTGRSTSSNRSAPRSSALLRLAPGRQHPHRLHAAFAGGHGPVFGRGGGIGIRNSTIQA